MTDFESAVHEAAATALLSIDLSDGPDIYAVSFFIFDDEDDPRLPILRIGYNTQARWHDCSPKIGRTPGWPVASDTSEAKWNYAFWLQNSLVSIGLSETRYATLRKQWLQKHSLWRSDDEIEADPEDFDSAATQITRLFVQLCGRISNRLHASGIVAAAVGKSVPIIVHELEYYTEIAQQTNEANPPGMAREFEEWVTSLYG